MTSAFHADCLGSTPSSRIIFRNVFKSRVFLFFMSTTIVDVTNCLVTPLLIYLGSKGITPRVVGVEGEEVLTLERVEGFRLGQLLRNEEFSKASASEVYGLLGEAVGTISRYGIVHGHLHSDNVVVTSQNKPVIIDWAQASYFPIYGPEGIWRAQNLAMLVEDLGKSKRRDRKELEGTLMRSFDTALQRPVEKSYRQIELETRFLIYPGSAQPYLQE